MNKIKQHIFFLIIFLLAAVGVYSQNIRKTQFKIEGNLIFVNYNLYLPLGKTADVELYYSTNGGATFAGPLKFVSGDVGEIEIGGDKTITWDVFEECRSLEGNLMFQVRANTIMQTVPQNFFAAYNISGSSAYGLTIGILGKWGLYARIKSNGQYFQTKYTASTNAISNYDGTGYYTFTDKIKRSRYGITAGYMQNVRGNLFIYAGAGYGERAVLWNAEEFAYENNEKISDLWAENTINTFKGAELEAGLFYKYKMMNFSIGCNLIDFNFYEINAGVGINLNSKLKK